MTDLYCYNLFLTVSFQSIGEDSEELSAAGQMLTVLGVRGIENVRTALFY